MVAREEMIILLEWEEIRFEEGFHKKRLTQEAALEEKEKILT